MWKAFKSLFVREKTNFKACDELQMKTDVAAAKLILPPRGATCTLFKKTSFQEENMECAKNPRELLDAEWIKFMMSQRVSSKAEEQDIYKSFHQDCSSFLNQVDETMETYKLNDMDYLSSKSQNRISEQDSACPEEPKFEDAVEHLVKGFEDPISNQIFPDLTDDSSDEQTTPGTGNTCAEVPSLPALPSMPDLNEGSIPLQILNQDKMESIEDVKSNNTLKDEIEKTKSSSSSPTLLKTTIPFKSDFNDEKNTLIVLNEGKMESIQDVESRTIHKGEIEKPESSSTLLMLLKSTPTEFKSKTRNVLVMTEGNSSGRTENSLSDSKETIVYVPNSNKKSMINAVFLNDSDQAESDATSNLKTLNIPQEKAINTKMQISPVPKKKVAKPKVSSPHTKKKILDLTCQPMLAVDDNNTTPKRKRSVSQNTPSCGNFRTPFISQKTALDSNCRMPSTTQDTIAGRDWRMPSTTQDTIAGRDWRMPSTTQDTIAGRDWRMPSTTQDTIAGRDWRMPSTTQDTIAGRDWRMPSTTQDTIAGRDWRMPSTTQDTIAGRDWRMPSTTQDTIAGRDWRMPSTTQDTIAGRDWRMPSTTQDTIAGRDWRMPSTTQDTIAGRDWRMPSTTQDTIAGRDWRMPSISQGAISSSDWRYPLSSHVDGSYYSLLSQVNGDHHGEVCHQDIYHNPAIFHVSQSAPMGNSVFVTVEYVDETYQTVHGMGLNETLQKKPNLYKYFYTVRPVSPFDGGALAKTRNKKIILIKKKDQASATQISGITNSTHPSGKLEKNLNQEKPNTQNSTVKVKEGVSNNTFNNLENTSVPDVGKLMLEIFKKQMAFSDATSNGKEVEQDPKCSASSLVCENALSGKLSKDNSTAMNLVKLMQELIQKKMGEASKVKKAEGNSGSSSACSKKHKNTHSSSGGPCQKKSCNTKYPSKRETSKPVLTPRSLRKRKIESYKV